MAESGGHEVVVVDGGSRDGGVGIAKDRSDWVELIESTGSRGARCNLGYTKTSGDVLLFLRPGTVLERGWSEAITAEAKKPGFTHGAFKPRSQSGGISNPFGGKTLDGSCGIFVSREVFEAKQGFKDADRGEDLDLIERLSEGDAKASRLGLSALTPRNNEAQSERASAIVLLYHAKSDHPAAGTFGQYLDDTTAARASRDLYLHARREHELHGDIMVAVPNSSLIEEANDIFGTGVCYISGHSVGAIFRDAFELGYERVFVVDPSYPELTAETFKDANASLDAGHVVIGPGYDNAAYLVAAGSSRAEAIASCTTGLPPKTNEVGAWASGHSVEISTMPNLTGCGSYQGFLDAFGRGLLQA